MSAGIVTPTDDDFTSKIKNIESQLKDLLHYKSKMRPTGSCTPSTRAPDEEEVVISDSEEEVPSGSLTVPGSVGLATPEQHVTYSSLAALARGRSD